MTATSDQPAPITEEQLAAWEAVERAATAGPWDVSSPLYFPHPVIHSLAPGGIGLAAANVQADGVFIATARTAVPALLAEVRRLRAELAAVRADAAEGDAILRRLGMIS